MALTTVDFVCGAECGIALVGTASLGTEHWSTVNGTPTVVTSGPATMRSTRAFRFNPSGAAAGLTHTFATAIASGGTAVVRLYVYFTTLPSATTSISYVETGAPSAMGVFFNSTDNTLRAGRTTANMAASGAVVTTGQWYLVEYKSVASASPSVDLRVNGVDQTQYTFAAAANTIPRVVLGAGASTFTADYYLDDVIVGHTSANYPIGEGTVVGLYPNGDVTAAAGNPDDTAFGHLYSATTDFGKGAGGATAVGAQNVESTSWQSLANPLSTSVATNFIADLLGGAAEHLVWTLPSISSAVATNGLMFVCATHSATATTNQFNAFLRTAAGATVGAQILGDLSEATITVPVIASANTSALSEAVAGTLRVVFGDSSDVNPDVYLDGACVEIDCVLRAARHIIVEPSLAASQAGRI